MNFMNWTETASSPCYSTTFSKYPAHQAMYNFSNASRPLSLSSMKHAVPCNWNALPFLTGFLCLPYKTKYHQSLPYSVFRQPKIIFILSPWIFLALGAVSVHSGLSENFITLDSKLGSSLTINKHRKLQIIYHQPTTYSALMWQPIPVFLSG